MQHLTTNGFYTNPLVNDDFPDPSIIAVPGDGYYAYATHDAFSPTLNNILVRHSTDLVNWSEAKGALAAPPQWALRCDKFWCPQVVKIGDLFCLYYAAEPDTRDGMCLALATSTTPVNFTDVDAPLSRVEGSTYQMIDPCCFIDPVSNKVLLYYGSAHEPIRAVELSADGLNIISSPVKVLTTGTTKYEQLREGAFATYNKQFNRYFMWVSGDNTWAENGYAISVFWSHHPLGPFEKIPGDHVILKPGRKWDSPGQNCIIKDAEHHEWIVYHAVDTSDRYIDGTTIFKRKMCMDRVNYTIDGWPYLYDSQPSSAPQKAPVVNTY